MKDNASVLEYKNREYKLVFNLNSMEVIQEEYGSIDKWAELTDGSEQNDGEPNIKAMIFGLAAMVNEGIEIDNEEKGENIKPITLKQAGRMLSEIGLVEAQKVMNETVIESTKSDEDNEKNE